MEYKDYYKALGVSQRAGANEIKSAYRKLARKYHPDLHPDDRKAEERFKETNEAYEVLKDAEKRKKYDELGANWEDIRRNRDYARRYTSPGFEWAGPESVDLNDFFETFFGGSGGRTRDRSPRGPTARTGRRGAQGQDVSHPVELTLEETFHGTTRQLQMVLEQPCPRCHGSGIITVAAQPRRRNREQIAMEACSTCGGRGGVSERKSLNVKIPRGVTQGSRVRLQGMGVRGSDGRPAGDLYLDIRVTPHRLFQVRGHDLLSDLPVRDDEAALGTTVQVPTLEGRVALKIPPGSQQGNRLRLKGKGLPQLHATGRGDLYYTLNIVTPATMSSEERELIQQLRRLREKRGAAGDPRHSLYS